MPLGLGLPDISLVVALGFIVRNADLGASGSEREVKASTLAECGCKLKSCVPSVLFCKTRALCEQDRGAQGSSLQAHSSSIIKNFVESGETLEYSRKRKHCLESSRRTSSWSIKGCIRFRKLEELSKIFQDVLK